MRSSAALKSTRVGRFRTSALTRRSSTFHFSRLPSSHATSNVWACRLLCEYGVDVNATLVVKRPRARNAKYAASSAHEGRHGTWDCWTPLMLATHLNLQEVCKLLVSYWSSTART